MKIWMRLLAGSAIGVLLGIFLPESGGDTARFFSGVSEFVIRVGRYFLFPVVFFGIAIGTHELRQDRKVLSLYLRSIVVILAATAAMILIGTLSVLILSPARIPPIFQEAPEMTLPNIHDLVAAIFPRNLFQIFSQPGSFLFPLAVLGFLMGLTLQTEKGFSEPLIAVFDSASRVFYRLSSVVIEILGVGLIALAAHSVFQLRAINDFEIYGQLLVILLFDVGLFVFIVFPLLVYFLGNRENPFVWLYGLLSPAIAAIFSGDAYFALPTLIRMGKENLGLPRRAGSAIFPLAAVIGKSGTALVASASFILILRSYTALEITFLQVLWVLVTTFGVSFLLGSVPGLGVVVALSLLSTAYGRGMEEVFLILRPITPILVSIGAFLDIVTAGFIGYLVSGQERMRKSVDQFDFV